MADIQKLNVNNTTYDISTTWEKVTGKPSTFTPSSHTHDGRYIKWGGSAADTNAMGWGTLTTANGYTILSHTSSSDGGDWGMVSKSGQISMQLDGYYYQNEGRYRVLNTSDSSSFAPSSHTHSYLPLSGGTLNGNLSLEAYELYWNGDANGSYISSNGTTDMMYNMRNGHIFLVGGDPILSIKRFSNYNLNVNGSANATTLYENGTRVSLSGHTHDDRYYTESEVTNLLAGKANSSHGTHLSGSAALYSNSSSGSNCNDVTYNLIGYYTSNGPSTSLGASTNDGTLYSQAYSSSWISQIAQDYRNGNLFTRGKNNGTWTAWKAVSYNGHTHKYAGSSSAGGAATSVVVTDSNANSTYRMVWHSGNSLYSTDNIYCNPSTDYLYSKGFYQTSDELLKTFYDPIKVDLDKLSKLRKNYFKFNDKDKLEIGVSAQEIQQLYPEIVSTDDNGYLSVAYDKLSVIALAAIDELDNKYKKEINDLKDQLDAIKNILNEKGIL